MSFRTGAEELQRYEQARQRAVRELTETYIRACQTVDERTASIFSIHAMLLEDDNLVNTTCDMIIKDGSTTEYAVYETGKIFAAAFAQMEDTYMQAKAADIRDITLRMLRILMGTRPQELFNGESAILVAEEMLPSQVFALDRRKMLGLITWKGSVVSHTAQILHTMKVPVLVGAEMDPAWDGHLALLDGYASRVYVDPDAQLMEELRHRYQTGGRPVIKTISE